MRRADAGELLSALEGSLEGVRVISRGRRYANYSDGGTLPLAQEAWVEVEPGRVREVVSFLMGFDFPHLIVMSGDDLGEAVEVNYHFVLFREAGRGDQLFLNLKVRLPKGELVLPSLYDLVPAADYPEREIRDMLGVRFEGLPVEGQAFVPDGFPELALPWRRDERAPGPELVKDLS